MSTAFLEELMARFIDPKEEPAANVANAAKGDAQRQQEQKSSAGEAVQVAAMLSTQIDKAFTHSQHFASSLMAGDGSPSKRPRASSQVSQDSQERSFTPRAPEDNSTGDALTSGEMTLFLNRRARLMRWGWTKSEAEKLSKRLLRNDDRVACADCRHYQPNTCGNHRQAGLSTSDVSRALATTLQRCPGFGRGKAILLAPSLADEDASHREGVEEADEDDI
jgi:hypothetical protein